LEPQNRHARRQRGKIADSFCWRESGGRKKRGVEGFAGKETTGNREIHPTGGRCGAAWIHFEKGGKGRGAVNRGGGAKKKKERAFNLNGFRKGRGARTNVPRAGFQENTNNPPRGKEK